MMRARIDSLTAAVDRWVEQINQFPPTSLITIPYLLLHDIE